jgi:hypothetical protein
MDTNKHGLSSNIHNILSQDLNPNINHNTVSINDNDILQLQNQIVQSSKQDHINDQIMQHQMHPNMLQNFNGMQPQDNILTDEILQQQMQQQIQQQLLQQQMQHQLLQQQNHPQQQIQHQLLQQQNHPQQQMQQQQMQQQQMQQQMQHQLLQQQNHQQQQQQMQQQQMQQQQMQQQQMQQQQMQQQIYQNDLINNIDGHDNNYQKTTNSTMDNVIEELKIPCILFVLYVSISMPQFMDLLQKYLPKFGVTEEGKNTFTGIMFRGLLLVVVFASIKRFIICK